jgi:hypothetical protein
VKLRFVVLLGVALAACDSVGNSPQAQCEREADKDPAVVEVYTRTNGMYTFPYTQRDDLIQATRQAVMRCMRSKGLSPPGGVQPVVPR